MTKEAARPLVPLCYSNKCQESAPLCHENLAPKVLRTVLRALKIYIFFSAPPKLDLDLGSTVSSVSDPDLSGASNKDTAKKGQQQEAGKLNEPTKPADGSQSEGKFF